MIEEKCKARRCETTKRYKGALGKVSDRIAPIAKGVWHSDVTQCQQKEPKTFAQGYLENRPQKQLDTTINKESTMTVITANPFVRVELQMKLLW